MLQALLSWRSDVTDVQWLQEHTSGKTNVAGRAAAHTRRLTGVDAELRLNAAVDEIDAMTGADPG